MPTGAPTATPAQRAALEKLQRSHQHRDQPPRPLAQPQTRGHHPMPTGAPTTTLAQRATQEKLRRSYGHGDQPPRPWWPSRGRGASPYAHGCTYYHPRTASCAREASVPPWACGSTLATLAKPRTWGHHPMPREHLRHPRT